MIDCVEAGIRFVYESYMEAEPYMEYGAADREKRHPEFLADVLRDETGAPAALITGSKGKGSVANILSQLLQTGMNRVGLFTSPHILDFRERIKVNGQMIPEKDFIDGCNAALPVVESVAHEKGQYVSPIGIQCLIGLEYFRKKETDFNIFECGKGVRYDDTKNIVRQYAAINPVFLEHTRELGDTLLKIAEDKSDVIEAGMKCVYIAGQKPGVMELFLRKAARCGVPVKRYGQDFRCEDVSFTLEGMTFSVVTKKGRYEHLSLPLIGTHQARNCSLAVAMAEDILGSLDIVKMRENLARVNYPGRLELIGKNPCILLDACIHAASVPGVREAIDKLRHQRLITIIAIPEDKDFAGVADAMAEISERVILTETSNKHYRFSREQLMRVADKDRTVYYEKLEDAISFARTSGADLILILGTTSLISDVHALMERKGGL